MKKKLFLPILTFLFFSLNFCFSQNNRKQLETKINVEIESKIKGLKEEVESRQMNPFTKNIYSEFAIDTFKIQYFNRRLNRFSKRFDGSPLDNNYYSEYCEIIRQRVLNLYFYYTDLIEH